MNPEPIPRSELEPICFALAEEIRAQRLARGWAPARLEEESRISRQMIGFVEKFQRVPTIQTAARFSRAFGIPLSRLIAEAERRMQL
jgi:transcriptional regulator with XRE-family HTH domain